MEEVQQILNDIGIEKIVDDIHNNKCILFLGPLMKAEYKGKVNPLSKIFCEQLLEDLKPANISFQEEARQNPFYVLAKYTTYVGGKTNLQKKLKTHLDIFIKASSSVYDSLSTLPFNTIINFGSDRMMQNALNKNGYEFSDKYYDYNGAYSQYLEGVDDNLQLVYNLLGSVNDFHSQVLTEEDQLLFMRKIVSGPKLPDNILSRLKDNPDDSKSYIFLGFSFEEWPFRFFLDVLQLPKTKHSASPKLPDYNIAFMTREFYQDRFGLNFVDLDPETFASKLVDAYTTKYNANNHKTGFIAYHDSDDSTFKRFSTHLNNSKLGRRIKFWSKEQIIAGDHKEKVIQQCMQEATVFIPLLSSRFLYDPQLTEQLRTMLQSENALIFPVIISNCDYASEFSDIIFRSSLILPGDDKVLVNTSETEPSDQIFLTMIKKINSKIR
jgi:hypothetical protein